MKKLVNKLIALLGVTLIAFGSVSTANATGVAENGQESISVGATATSIDDCNWYFSGVGDGETNSLTLVNPTAADYVGSDLLLSGTDTDLAIYLSGSSEIADDCSFYGDVRGANVSVEWLGSGFTANGVDDSLDWLLTESPLLLNVDDSEICSDWTLTEVSLNADGLGAAAVVPLSISNVATASYDPVGEIAPPTFPSCSFEIDYSTEIPGGNTPEDGGSDFTFTGPVVTLTLVINSAS